MALPPKNENYSMRALSLSLKKKGIRTY